MNTRTKWVFGAAAIIAAVVLARFGLPAETVAAPVKTKSLPLVSVAEARTLDLPVRYAVQGHLVALNQVDVRPQVNGTIRSIHFKEGDEVQQGQLMFVLDAADASAQLQRAKAQVAQTAASLANEQRNQQRAAKLADSGYISSSEMDALASKVDALQAQLRASRADVAAAQTQLDRTRIVAPLSGKTGAVQVHPGSLAQQGDAAPLVNLVQLDPIGVEFSLPEPALGGLLRADAAKQTHVSVLDADGNRVEGDLRFINNAVTTSSGTISLKAHFPNAKHRLWPGAFVRVTLDAGFDKGVVVLPPQAVQEGPEGHFVFTLDAEQKTVSRPVKLLRIQEQHAVVEGVKAGEVVVVEGGRDLRAGKEVQVAEQGLAIQQSGGAP